MARGYSDLEAGDSASTQPPARPSRRADSRRGDARPSYTNTAELRVDGGGGGGGGGGGSLAKRRIEPGSYSGNEHIFNKYDEYENVIMS